MNNDFLVAIITYKRPEFFSQCLSSVLQFVSKEQVVVINDGSPYSDEIYQGVKVLQNEVNMGVACTKSRAMTYFLNGSDKKYLFLLEDDIILKRPDVFETYIKASNKSGIEHFNYGPGSPFNRKQNPNIPIDLHTRHLLDQNSEPNPRMIVDYGDLKISLYPHTVAMFSFFTRQSLEKVGCIDEDFSEVNAWEHCLHTYQIYQAGLTTPFWWFADIFDSHKYLSEAPGAIEQSAIAKNKTKWMEGVMKGREIFKGKCGYYPNEIPNMSEQDVINFLKKMKQNR